MLCPTCSSTGYLGVPLVSSYIDAATDALWTFFSSAAALLRILASCKYSSHRIVRSKLDHHDMWAWRSIRVSKFLAATALCRPVSCRHCSWHPTLAATHPSVRLLTRWSQYPTDLSRPLSSETSFLTNQRLQGIGVPDSWAEPVYRAAFHLQLS